MGAQERENTKRVRRNEIKKIILTTVQVAGVLAVGLTAPKALRAFEKLGIFPSLSRRRAIHNTRGRLVRAGLLSYENGFLRLTKKGERALIELDARAFQLPKPKRWDKKWRVLVFDIPEYRKGLREKVRRTLQAIGFVRLQDSVWVYPYDCEDLITLLKADFKIGKDLLYMIVDSIENDRTLRSRFSLPPDRA